MKRNHQAKDRYEAAAIRVKEIKGFYLHLITYFVFNTVLLLINYATYWEYKWFLYPLIGWGIGIAIHWFVILGYGSKWEEEKIRDLMKEQNIN